VSAVRARVRRIGRKCRVVICDHLVNTQPAIELCSFTLPHLQRGIIYRHFDSPSLIFTSRCTGFSLVNIKSVGSI
jgi:hypothetical protein